MHVLNDLIWMLCEMLHAFVSLSAVQEDWYRFIQGNSESTCHYNFCLDHTNWLTNTNTVQN